MLCLGYSGSFQFGNYVANPKNIWDMTDIVPIYFILVLMSHFLGYNKMNMDHKWFLHFFSRI